MWSSLKLISGSDTRVKWLEHMAVYSESLMDLARRKHILLLRFNEIPILYYYIKVNWCMWHICWIRTLFDQFKFKVFIIWYHFYRYMWTSLYFFMGFYASSFKVINWCLDLPKNLLVVTSQTRNFCACLNDCSVFILIHKYLFDFDSWSCIGGFV